MKTTKRDTVRNIMMSSPVTLAPGDHLGLAEDIISLGRIRHIPVVEGGKIVGLLSQRNLMGSAAVRLFRLTPKKRSAMLKTVQVQDVMIRRVVTVGPDTPVKEAAGLMAKKKIGCLPVVSQGALAGLITTTNLLRYLEEIA